MARSGAGAVGGLMRAGVSCRSSTPCRAGSVPGATATSPTVLPEVPPLPSYPSAWCIRSPHQGLRDSRGRAPQTIEPAVQVPVTDRPDRSAGGRRHFLVVRFLARSEICESMAEGMRWTSNPVAGWAEVGPDANVRYLEANHRLVGRLHLQYPGPRRVTVNLGPRPESSTAILRAGCGQAEADRVSQCQ